MLSVGTRWCGALRIRRPRLRSAATHARRTLRTQRISCGLATRGSSATLHPTVGRSTPGTGTDLALLALAPDKRAPLSLRTVRRVHGRVSTSARECAQDWPNAGRLTAQPLGADARAMDGRRAGRRGGPGRQMGDRTRRRMASGGLRARRRLINTLEDTALAFWRGSLPPDRFPLSPLLPRLSVFFSFSGRTPLPTIDTPPICTIQYRRVSILRCGKQQ